MSDLQAAPSTRSIWSGRISIGLVNVPVKLYTMIKDQSFSFKLVRKDDACPLKYERVCTFDDKVIPWSDVGRAVEVRKGEFVVFTDEELQSLRPDSSKKIAINKFVPLNQVDRIFYDTSYILAPDKSDESYGLMLKAFIEKKLAGVGKFTLRTKEYPVIVYPYHDALILTTLRYGDEVVDPQSVKDIENVKDPSKEELKLALKIIDTLTRDFDIKDFKDTFREEVQKLVEKKMKGETIVVEEPKAEEVRGLMQALKETLSQMQQQ
ncbi:Ku protein [Candidatus Bathyarchaeota archaeon]|nr:Ku protein [Candidatus Bathyarchaeota archaeon]